MVRKKGATVKGESIAWFKSQQAYIKWSSHKSSKDVKEYSLKGGKLNMLTNQWVLQLQGTVLRFEPLDLADYAFIGTFCEILIDAGVVLGESNQTDATPAASTHVTYRHFGAPGTIKIVLTGDGSRARILELLPYSPAAQTPGLKEDMRIVKINGKSVAGYPLKMVTQRIRDASHPIDITFAPPVRTTPSISAPCKGMGMNRSASAPSLLQVCAVAEPTNIFKEMLQEEEEEEGSSGSDDSDEEPVECGDANDALNTLQEEEENESSDEELHVAEGGDGDVSSNSTRGGARDAEDTLDLEALDALAELDALRGSFSGADDLANLLASFPDSPLLSPSVPPTCFKVDNEDDDDLEYLLSLQDSEEE